MFKEIASFSLYFSSLAYVLIQIIISVRKVVEISNYLSCICLKLFSVHYFLISYLYIVIYFPVSKWLDSKNPNYLIG